MFKKFFNHTMVVDGEEMMFTLRSLRRTQMFQLAPFLEKMSTGNGDDEETVVTLNIEDNCEFMEVASSILGDNIQISEVVDKEFKQNLLEEAYYMEVVGTLIGILVQKAYVRGDDVKKSEKPSTDIIPE